MGEDLKCLLETYHAGKITRREFMQRAMLWTGSVAVASSLLDSLSPSLPMPIRSIRMIQH